LSGCAIGSFLRRAQLHKWVSDLIQESLYGIVKRNISLVHKNTRMFCLLLNDVTVFVASWQIGKKLAVAYPVTSPTLVESVTGRGGQIIKEGFVLQGKGNI
jgi:hypothetical protein